MPPGIACTLRGLFTPFRPILPEATRGKKKQSKKGKNKLLADLLCRLTPTHVCECSHTVVAACKQTLFVCTAVFFFLFPSSPPCSPPVWPHRRRSVCDFTSLAGPVSRSSAQRLFPCNYCPVNRSAGLESSHSCCSFQQLTHACTRTPSRTPQPSPHKRPRPGFSEWY